MDSSPFTLACYRYYCKVEIAGGREPALFSDWLADQPEPPTHPNIEGEPS